MVNFIKQILCYSDILHDYRIKKVLTADAVKCECITCGKTIAYNHAMQYCIPWNNQVADFYKSVAKEAKELASQKEKEESDYIKLKTNYL